MEEQRKISSSRSHYHRNTKPRNPNMDPTEHLSRTLCWYLRHWVQPEELHPGGWVDIDVMMSCPTFSAQYSVQNIIDHVNAQGEYRRIDLKEDSVTGKLQIRAKHFHSREVEQTDWNPLNLENENLIVVYLTTARHIGEYISEGFRPKNSRTHIHFWIRDRESEKILAADVCPVPRPIFIYIDWKLALKDGLEFFQSEDGMVMTRGNSEAVLEPRYIEKVVDIVSGKLFSTLPSWTQITNDVIVVDPTSEEEWKEMVNRGYRPRPCRKNLYFWLADPNDECKVLGPACQYDIFIYINVQQALNDGFKFYQNEEGMVKTPGNSDASLEPFYIKKVVNIKTGEIYWNSPQRITSAVGGPILVHPTCKANWEQYRERGFFPEKKKSSIRFMVRDPNNPNIILGEANEDENYDIFIYIDLKRALTDGWKFFLREDGSAIALCDRHRSVLDPKYIDKVVDLTTGKPLRFF